MPDTEILQNYSKGLIRKASAIRALFFDVDGVLTDGSIVYDDAGKETKSFNVKDGYIISHLKKAGLMVGIITGRESTIVANRAAELKMDFCYQAVSDKYSVFQKILNHHSLKKKEVAYIGDDLNDLQVLQSCGLSACPQDAPDYIKQRVDLTCRVNGGRGVAREVADLILESQGLFDKLLPEVK